MIVFSLLGAVLLVVAVVRGFQAWTADRRMQRHRRDEPGPAAYLFVPLRWQKRLYRPEAHPLVERVWRRTGAMYGYGVAGAILVLLGNG